MSKPMDTTSKEFLEAIRTSELGAQIARDLDQAKLDERKQLANELVALHKDVESSFPKLIAAQEKALADFKKAEAALQAARLKLANANSAKLAASANYTARRNELEKQLADSASPLIAEFISWCRDDMAATRKSLQTRYWTERHAITSRRQDCSESNRESVAARLAALASAIESAQEMALIADQSRVPETIGRIKSELPAIMEL